MLLVLLTAFVCVACFLQQQAANSVLFAIAGIWIISRAFGVSNYPIWSLLVNAVLIAAATILKPGDVFTGMLVALLVTVSWVDVTEFYYRYLLEPTGRKRLREFALRHGLRIIWFGALGFILINGIVAPVISDLIYRQRSPVGDVRFAMERLTLAENITFNLCESLAALFTFVLGTCVGSFLNVVIYRVPRRISVLIKPSHCPGCSEKISGKDNVPGIGWLKLKGKCRNCGISISSRYPTIELLVGLLFLLLYFVELISGGTNLPGLVPEPYAGVQWILFYTKWNLVSLYCYHTLLICTLFSWGMIRRDNQEIPVTTATIMLIAFGALPLQWPFLTPLPGLSAAYSLKEASITLILGGVAAVSVISVGRLIQRKFSIKIIPFEVAPWLLIGISLGWQAVAGIFVCCLILRLLQAFHSSLHGLSRHDLNISIQNKSVGSQHLLLSLAVVIQHSFWRTIVQTLSF